MSKLAYELFPEQFREPYPLTQVGSGPKLGSFKSTGRHNEGSMAAAKKAIALQESLGYKFIVDWEQDVGDMSIDRIRAMDYPLTGWSKSYRNRFWKKGEVTLPLRELTEYLSLPRYEFAQAQTSLPVKGVITGPKTMALWNLLDLPGYDPYAEGAKRQDIASLLEDLTYEWADKVVNVEAKALQAAGCKFIQIDEPAVGQRWYEQDVFVKGLEKSTDGIDAYTGAHMCYVKRDKYAKLVDMFKVLPVDHLCLEFCTELDKGLESSEFLREVAKDPLTNYKDVKLDLIDIRPGTPVESVDDVVERGRRALDVFAPEKEQHKRIFLGPGCGWRTLKDEKKALAKQEVLPLGAKVLRRLYFERYGDF